jgi:6-phosphogluconate dehydrogenase
LGNIKSAYDKNESLENLLMDEFFTDAINKCQLGWRKVIATATVYGIPIPCLSTGKRFLFKKIKLRFIFSALAFYDGYRAKRLPANLIQVN